MSTNLACARARVAAGEWLARYCGIQDPKTMTFSVAELLKAFEEGYLTRINDDVLGGDELTLTATVLDAASSGMGPFTENDLARAAKAMFAARDRIERLIKGQAALTDQRTIENAIGQRQLDDATALMTEAAELFRSYEARHRDKIMRFRGRNDVPKDIEAFKALQARTDRDALMAARLEAWLRGEDFYPVKPGAMSGEGQAAQEAFVSAALDAGVDLITEADEPIPGFHEGGYVKEGPTLRDGEVAAVLSAGGPLVAAMTMGIDEISSLPVASPPPGEPDAAPAQSLADVRRHWAEGAGFKYRPGGDGAPDDLDEDGEVMIDWGEQTESGPRFTMCGVGELTPMPGLWAETIDPESFGTIIGYHADPTLRPISVERVRVKGVTVETQQEIRYEVEGQGLDLTRPILINGVPYAPTDFPTPGDAAAKGQTPRDLVAGEPDPRAALVHARNWLISAESLIAEASAFIRGVTGANPGSDSEDICQRLDAWLTPMATPAPQPTEEKS